MKQNSILLVNPWIADFAAYDLWAKPLGLLYIASFLQKYGYEISLLDFLDRNKWKNGPNKSRGKYKRTPIPKPKMLQHIKRNFALYGADEKQINHALGTMKPPTAILITSFMTYWYIGIQKTITVLRKYFPDVPIILGGSYVTLNENHAHNHIDADYFISGYGEKKSLKILDALHGFSRDYSAIPEFDDTNFPAYDLYEAHDTLPLMTSRGCPKNCSFCATRQLHKTFSRRCLENLKAEIEYNINHYGVTDYAFYDDALFVDKENYIMPFLEYIINRKESFKFYSPNGLFARSIDKPLANLMKAAGFSMIRLSLESAISKWQKASSNKVSQSDFEQACDHLENAGYNKSDVEAYLIMGLPGQTFNDVKKSIDFVYNCGAISRLASFTPIPGTQDWQRAIKQNLINNNIDPLLTNNTLFPCASDILTVDQFQQLKQLSTHYNHIIKNPEQKYG